MSSRLIDIILKDEKRTEEEKNEIIKRLVDIEEGIISLAKERDISILEAICSLSKEKNIDIGPINYDELLNAVKKGIEWLKSQQHNDGGWGWDMLQCLKNRIPENDFEKSIKSIAWSTSVSLLSFYEWKNYFGDQTLNKNIKRGIECLKGNRNQDECWSSYPFDLPTLKENTNVFDTSISVLAILEIEKDPEFVSGAIKKLKILQTDDGGWIPSKEDQKIDVGATSLAVQALMGYNQVIRSTARFKRPIKVEEEIKRGIDWLIENQQIENEFGWSEREKGVHESFITRTYDALETLINYDPYKNKEDVKRAIDKGVDWLLDSIRFESEDKIGLAWRSDKIQMSNIENTAVAIIALLDCGMDPMLLEIEEGINWLLEKQKEDGGWHPSTDTPRAILCLVKFMEKMYGKMI